MGFSTRTLYRSAFEELARGSRHDELDVARRAVAAAATPYPASPLIEQSRRADVGYHLLAGGRREFEAALGFDRRASGRPA
jgi:cyclic beta-1,2-glucan synthetase